MDQGVGFILDKGYFSIENTNILKRCYEYIQDEMNEVK